MPSKPKPTDMAEAARMLRELLALVAAGEIEATSPTARALVRRIEGAVIAAELAVGQGSPSTASSDTLTP